MKEKTFQNDVLPLKDKLFRLALRITLNREDAEDMVQDTLLKVWQQMQENVPIDNMEALAMTICRNHSIDLIQLKQQQNVSFDSSLHDRPDSTLTAQEQMEQGEKVRRMEKLLDMLPEKQRTAIQLRDIEGRSYKEISGIMGITESDVKVNIFRARQKLKDAAQ
jgi:RNA polymerase sigma-70 factor (ECF subfamily)